MAKHYYYTLIKQGTVHGFSMERPRTVFKLP